jgi:hypothetical protein
VSADVTIPSRSDRWGMYLTIGACTTAVIATAWAVIARLVTVFSPNGVPVDIPFVDEAATLPIGPAGSGVEVEVDRAIVTVTDPAPATFFALVAEPIVTGLAIIAGVVLLLLFCVNVARGRAFARSTVRIVTSGAVVLLVGWGLGTLFRTMGVNGTLAAVSDHDYEGVLFETDFTAFFALLALGAIGVAFQIGHRLQRDAEGLV